jgi:hypothetical protein
MIDSNNWIYEIDSGGQSIRLWAINYLRKNNWLIHSPYEHIPPCSISEIIQHIPPSPNKELMLRKMRSAFDQKQLRDKKNGRKSYNFIMSTQIQQILKSLARDIDKPMNETLELIIRNDYQLVREFKLQEKRQKKSTKRL